MKQIKLPLFLSAFAAGLFITVASISAGPDEAMTKSAETASVEWMTDFEAAKAKAVSEKKPLLVDFTGSDWCGWCIKLDKEVFSKEAFRDYAKENLVLVEIDFPRRKELPKEQLDKNYALVDKYGVQGFPTILVLSSDGKVIERTGYRRGGPEKYVEHLKAIVATYKPSSK